MTTVLVLADTHWDLVFADRVLDAHPEASVLVHLGDFCDDAVQLAARRRLPLRNVRGNGDADCAHGCALEEEFVVEGHRLLLVHGHRYGVKDGLGRLADHAFAHVPPVDAVLFGHTHRPCSVLVERRGRTVMLLNPGSTLRSPASSRGPSAVLLRVSPGPGLEGLDVEWIDPSALASPPAR